MCAMCGERFERVVQQVGDDLKYLPSAYGVYNVLEFLDQMDFLRFDHSLMNAKCGFRHATQAVRLHSARRPGKAKCLICDSTQCGHLFFGQVRVRPHFLGIVRGVQYREREDRCARWRESTSPHPVPLPCTPRVRRFPKQGLAISGVAYRRPMSGSAAVS